MIKYSKTKKGLFSFWLLLCILSLLPLSAYAGYDILRPGDSSTEVKQMQEALNDLGFDTNGIDGKYGKGTVKAVELFQKAQRLKVDGIAGEQTLTLLFQKAGSDNALRPGSSGSDVSKLQQALKDLNYAITSVDGKYGSGTQSAVKSFQRKNGLTADGIAGTNTLNLLYSGTAQGSGSSSGSGSGGSSGGTSSTLRFGDTGEGVQQLQKALTALGYDTNGTEGKYGKGTQKAVRAFQRANNLKVDGVAGTSTLARLYSGSSNGNTSGDGGSSGTSTTLRFGDNGSAVKEMQKALNALGYSTNGTDGKYGTGTREAVKQFQKANKLTADGIAGSKTLTKLYSLSGSGGGSGSSGSIFTRTLRSGYTGNDVDAVQSKLHALKYLTGSLSKVYDSSTISAVKTFQKQHGLSADGLVGQSTFNTLFGPNAKENSSGGSSGGSGSDGGGNSGTAPNKSDVQLLHWFNEVKPSIRSGQTYYVYHPGSGLGWTMKFYSLGRHADSEPLTASDTATMNKAFGKTSWDPMTVYAKLPNGKWTLATMHNTPHLNGSIKDNDFEGHLCVHFLRDMSETEKNDPNYGVTNQKVIRKSWKALTGQDYVESY